MTPLAKSSMLGGMGSSMTDQDTIYVRLLDEELDVWRPVKARRINDAYQILDYDYDADVETWEFTPGQIVLVEKDSEGGCLKAIRSI